MKAGNILDNNLISRQAVLDLVNADWKYEGLEEPINSLPSVNPQKPKSEWEHDHEILKAYSDGASAVLEKIREEIQSIRGYYCYASDAVIGSDAIIDDIEKIIDKYAEEDKE